MFTPIKMLGTHRSGLTPCSRASGYLDHLPSLSSTWNGFPLGSEGEASMRGWLLMSRVSHHHMQIVRVGSPRAVSSEFPCVCRGHGHLMEWPNTPAVGSAQGSVTSWPLRTPQLYLHGLLTVAATVISSCGPSSPPAPWEFVLACSQFLGGAAAPLR